MRGRVRRERRKGEKTGRRLADISLNRYEGADRLIIGYQSDVVGRIGGGHLRRQRSS